MDFLRSGLGVREEENKPPPVVMEFAEWLHAEGARGKLRERDVDDRLSYLGKRI